MNRASLRWLALLAVLLLFATVAHSQLSREDPGARLHAWEAEADRDKARQIYEQISARVLASNHAMECYQLARAARQAFDAILANGASVINVEARSEAMQAAKAWAKCERIK